MTEIYLDHNASSPLDPRVLESMLPHLEERFGNASSLHRHGQAQAGAVEIARAEVATLLGAHPSRVVFTSGATEANNLALKGTTDSALEDRPRVLISAGEHASVRNVAGYLADLGRAKVDVVPLMARGEVDLVAFEELLADDVDVVSVMAANSETGVLNDVAAIGAAAHAVGALFHCDATQWVGRLPFDMDVVGADLVSMSSHKIYGPMGVGALAMSRSASRRLVPQMHGGGHEGGLRSGSVNVAGVVGLGAAAQLVESEREAESARCRELRDRLVEGLSARLPDVVEIGREAERLPNTASVRFSGADAEAVLVNLAGVSVSTGSACSSGAIEPSHVLTAMGIDRDAAFEVLRFSLGRGTTPDGIQSAIGKIADAVGFVREAGQP